jgi:hypothetical protein
MSLAAKDAQERHERSLDQLMESCRPERKLSVAVGPDVLVEKGHGEA